jgi:hypothetical protein
MFHKDAFKLANGHSETASNSDKGWQYLLCFLCQHDKKSYGTTHFENHKKMMQYQIFFYLGSES